MRTSFRCFDLAGVRYGAFALLLCGMLFTSTRIVHAWYEIGCQYVVPPLYSICSGFTDELEYGTELCLELGDTCENFCETRGVYNIQCGEAVYENGELVGVGGSCVCNLCPVGQQWDESYNTCNESPLLINLSSNTANYHLTSAEDGVQFDISGRGVKDQVAWTRTGSNVAFLTLDLNQNGAVDDGKELFGSATRKRDGSRAANGFEALLDLDGGPTASDGTITASDDVYNTLKLWRDINHDGYSEPDELLTLHEAGVTTIFTEYSENNRYDQHGNSYKYEGTALRLNRHGREARRRIFDVYLKVIPSQTE